MRGNQCGKRSDQAGINEELEPILFFQKVGIYIKQEIGMQMNMMAAK